MAMSGSIFDVVMGDKEDNFSEAICAICDNGGELICCEGKCLRSFHATVEDGIDSACPSLQLSEKLIKEDNFTCENCRYNQHQCYVCGKLGSSNKSDAAEVFQCGDGTCGYFYHPSCVANSLRFKYEDHKPKVIDIASGKPFICPLHFCYACKQKEQEHETDFLMQFAVCRRCPMAYHRKCLPGTIAFEADDDEGIITRAWEDLIPNKVLIYCMEHMIDDELETPIRDYIKFPHTNLKKEEQAMESVGDQVKNVPRKRLHRPSEVLERRNVSKPFQCSQKLPEAGQVDKSSLRCMRSSGVYYLREPKLPSASKQLHKSSSMSYLNFSGSYLLRDRKLVTKYKMASLIRGLKRKASTIYHDSSSGKNMNALLSNRDSSGSEKRMISNRELAGNKDSPATKLENRRSFGSEKRSKNSKEEETNKDYVASKLKNPKASGSEKRSESIKEEACNTDHVVSKFKNRESSGSERRSKSSKEEANKDFVASKLENPKTYGSEKRSESVKEVACNKDHVVSKLENRQSYASKKRSRSSIEVEANKDYVASKLEIPKAYGLEKQSESVIVIALTACNEDHVVSKLEIWKNSASKKRSRSNEEVEDNKDSLVSKLEILKSSGLEKQGESVKVIACNKDLVVSKLENRENSASEERSRSNKEVEANRDFVVRKLENREVFDSGKRSESVKEVSGNKYHVFSKLENWENSVLRKQRSKRSKKVEANKDYVVSKLENPEASGSRKRNESVNDVSCNKDLVVSKLENRKASGSEKQSKNVKEVADNKEPVVSKLENQESFGLEKRRKSSKEVVGNKNHEKANLESRERFGGIDKPRKSSKENAYKYPSGSRENHSFISDMHKSTSCSKSVFMSLGFALGPYCPPSENNSVGWLTE